MESIWSKLIFAFLFFILTLSCNRRRGNIDVRNINGYIQDYYDIKADTLDYSKFNLEAKGMERIISINPRINSLEFILIDSSENNISYYKNGIEKQYSLKTNKER